MTTATQLLDVALLQSAVESYLDQIENPNDEARIREILKIGNNDPIKLGLPADSPILPGATRFTDIQAKWFTDNYEIVTHYPNDASGFSATLFKRVKDDPITGAKVGEYTLSFRSTEYQFQDKGGDYERDGSAAADGDIVTELKGSASINF